MSRQRDGCRNPVRWQLKIQSEEDVVASSSGVRSLSCPQRSTTET
jgi:hypothetical protein